jgi:hypothetical protein
MAGAAGNVDGRTGSVQDTPREMVAAANESHFPLRKRMRAIYIKVLYGYYILHFLKLINGVQTGKLILVLIQIMIFIMMVIKI